MITSYLRSVFSFEGRRYCIKIVRVRLIFIHMTIEYLNPLNYFNFLLDLFQDPNVIVLKNY